MVLKVREASAGDLPRMVRDVNCAVGRTFEDELSDQRSGIHSIFLALDPAATSVESALASTTRIREPTACTENWDMKIRISSSTTMSTLTLSLMAASQPPETCADIW
jgi:hypothetical protein